MNSLLIVFLYHYICSISLWRLSSSYFGSPDLSSLHSFTLFSLVRSQCGLGGNVHLLNALNAPHSTYPRSHDPWRSSFSSWTSTSLSSEPSLPTYPASMAPFLSHCIIISLWFYAMGLRSFGFSFSQWQIRTTKLIFPQFWTPPSLWLSSDDPDDGPNDGPFRHLCCCLAHIKRCLTFRDTFAIPQSQPRSSRKQSNYTKPNRLKLLMLLSALNNSVTESHTFQLSSELKFRQQLRRCRSLQGDLQAHKLKPTELFALQRRIKSSNETFSQVSSNDDHMFSAIADSGCSYSATNKFTDVEPASIRKLSTPISLGGIAGGLLVEYIGTANWETLNDQGEVVPICEQVLIHEDLPNRLLSPQAFLSHNSKGEKSGNVEDHFRIYHNRAEWHQQGKRVLSMNFDSSFLPRLTLFPKGKAVASLKALSGVLHTSNRNLSPLQKIWMQWHYKLGHLSFSHVQSLGIGGFLDKYALGLLRTKVPDHPICTACQYGKQVRTHHGTTTTTKNADSLGALKAGQLQPGDRIFCDQLESRVRGRLLHTAGKEADRDKFCGSSVFYDAASGYIHVEHQVTLNASDSINAKENFERLGLEHGVAVQSYHTDNGIFQSQAYVKHLVEHHQSIRYSGKGAKWQNGVSKGAICIVVSKARTIMIHAALHWPEVDDDSLWPLAVSHASYLYNHTPNPESGIAPIEIFTRTTTDGQALRKAHPWGCPVYVLEPRLTDAGGKIPKWQPRSRRAQYVGVSPVHAENIGLVRNLTTGYLSPQYHLVYDDWFDTVYSNSDEPPPEWGDMCIFNRFETFFDEDTRPPRLADEWLTPEEQALDLSRGRLQDLRQGRTWQDSKTKDSRDDFTYEAPPQTSPRETPERQKEPPTAPPREHSPSWTREHPIAPPREQPSAPPREPPSAPPREPPKAPSTPPTKRNPPRSTRGIAPTRLSPNAKLKSYDRPSSLLAFAMASTLGVTPVSAHMLQAHIDGYNPISDTQESIHPGIPQSPLALKAKASRDPDLPTLKESLTGPHSEQFWTAMDTEMASLEGKGTWKITDRSSLPPGTKPVPGTWVQRIKRLPDGQLNKFKSRWCCRGDLQDYDGNAYSPLVGWPTVRAGMLLAATHGWKSRQVDFTLAFCQSPQPPDQPLFMELPQYYRPKGCEGRDVILQLQKSLYGQVDSPKLFYEHLGRGMAKLGFEPSASDPCLFIHKELQIMVLNYCDDQIWLSPDNDLIEEYVQKLQDLGYDLTLEDQGDIFGFLGINFERKGANIELTQTGLINKVIKYTGMEGASSKPSPAAPDPLGADKLGEPFDEEWSYPSAIGMLLYLASNTRPDLTFSVHQAARFSHNPRKSHAQAVKRIIRYLLDTKDKGIIFEPKPDQGLDCWVDADFAGLYGYEDEQDPTSVKSRTGFCLTLFGCPVIWSSKMQTDITLSSTAAEYVAFSMAMRELLPMRALLKEIGTKLKLPTINESLVRSTVFEDNQGCLSLVNVPKMSPRNKYLSLKYHFFRSNIGPSNGIVAKYISTLEQRADIFTKGLPPTQFAVIRKLLMGW